MKAYMERRRRRRCLVDGCRRKTKFGPRRGLSACDRHLGQLYAEIEIVRRAKELRSSKAWQQRQRHKPPTSFQPRASRSDRYGR